jgi:hypothetical protein
MTQPRKGLRPLSQSGLIRIPRSAGQRVPDGDHKRAALEAFNEHAEGNRQLHPTKGWRTLSPKRARAQYLVAEILSGQARPFWRQGRFIREGF